jgi:hypothetical protein
MRPMTGLVLLASLLCLTPACGDGDDSAIRLPVDPSRSLDSLTAQEIDAICDELYRATFAVLNKERTCMLSAHLAAQLKGGDKAACEGYYEICMKSELDLTPSSTCSLKKKPQAVKACKATAQELEDCANASLEITESYVSGLSCASSKPFPVVNPPSCAGITAKCPGIW